MQPFRIEISSEHSSSSEEIVQNENNNNPDISVWESQCAHLTDHDNMESKLTEQDTDYHLFLRLMGHTLSSSQLCHCRLCKYSYILLLILNTSK